MIIIIQPANKILYKNQWKQTHVFIMSNHAYNNIPKGTGIRNNFTDPLEFKKQEHCLHKHCVLNLIKGWQRTHQSIMNTTKINWEL